MRVTLYFNSPESVEHLEQSQCIKSSTEIAQVISNNLLFYEFPGNFNLLLKGNMLKWMFFLFGPIFVHNLIISVSMLPKVVFIPNGYVHFLLVVRDSSSEFNGVWYLCKIFCNC